jgi:uncharacterized damage-inducible protein DinB
MRASEVRQLYDYNYWATARILAAAEKAPSHDTAVPAPMAHGSVLGTLAHTLAAEVVWRVRCEEGRSPASIATARDFPDLSVLRERWVREEAAMRGFLAGLDDAALDRVVRYRSTDRHEHENALWQILLHLANHGTQHRGEAGAELTRLGSSPGDIDFMLYLRTVNAPARTWLAPSP